MPRSQTNIQLQRTGGGGGHDAPCDQWGDTLICRLAGPIIMLFIDNVFQLGKASIYKTRRH